MRKWFLVLIAAVLALPLFGTSVFAEEEVVYEDGDHAIKAISLKKDSDDPSGAAGFINEKAVLKIVDGKAILVITVPHNEMAEVTGIQIEGTKATVTEDAAAKYMAFPLETIKAELNAQVQYEVPAIDMKGDEPFRFILEGLQEIPVVEEEPEEPEEDPAPEQPEEPAKPENPEPTKPEQPTEPEDDNEADQEKENVDSEFAPDEAYTITYKSDIPLERYFHNPAALLYKDGKAYIQIVGNMGQYVDYLTINGEKITLSDVDTNDNYIAQFEVASLDATYELGMYIDTPIGPMEHTAEISFVEKTKQEVDVNNYSLLAPEQGKKPGKDPKEDKDKEKAPKEDKDKNKVTPTKPEKPAGKDKDNKKTPKTKAPKKDDGLVPDKAYEINYVIKHETEDRPSAADSFFVKPAILLEKDGVYYLQVTVKGSEFINSIKNEFGEFVFVRENVDGSVVYQLKIGGKLTDEIILDMVLTVPGVYENQEHTARLILDPGSMKAIDVSNYLLVASTNANGPDAENAQDPEENAGITPGNNNPGNINDTKSGNKKLDPNTPEKPLLGDSNNITGNKSVDTNTNSSGPNPKTGEETNIMLYLLLLIASAIPLAVQLKKRFA